MKSKQTALAYVCLIVTFFCWGSVYVANGYILRTLTPLELACCRFLVSSVALGISIAVLKEKLQVEKKDWKYMIFIAFMGYYLSMECTLMSVKYAGSSLASLINSLNPVFITVFAAFFLKEALTKKKVGCLLLALVGAVIVSSGDTAGGQAIGVVYGIGSILAWAWTAMYSRRLSARYSPLIITFLGITGSLVFHIPTAVVNMVQSGVPEVTSVTILAILYSGLVGTAFPQFLWNFALSRLPASTCSMFYPLMPVFSTLLGVALFGETVTLRFLLGGALIVSVVVVSCIELPGHHHSPVHKAH